MVPTMNVIKRTAKSSLYLLSVLCGKPCIPRLQGERPATDGSTHVHRQDVIDVVKGGNQS